MSSRYGWETTGARGWEALEDGAKGLRMNTAQALQQKQDQRAARKAAADGVPANVRRGIIRHLVLCVDMSNANHRAIDYRPSRLQVLHAALAEFLPAFFDLNPLSHLMMVVTKGSSARIASEWGCQVGKHLKALKQEIVEEPEGLPSIMRTLELALTPLKGAPEYATREVLYVASSLCTDDVGNIHSTVAGLRQHRVRCSVVGMGGEMHILRQLANDTGGTYHVAMDSQHLRNLIVGHKDPPPLEKGRTSKFAHPMRVGFPQKVSPAKWDVDVEGGARPRIFRGGYACPQCKTRCNGQLPLTCHVCGLNLLSSPHLARSYHHLIAVPAFVEVPRVSMDLHGGEVGQASLSCFCCNEELRPDRDLIFKCSNCNAVYADKCVDFAGGTLFNCGSCLQHNLS